MSDGAVTITPDSIRERQRLKDEVDSVIERLQRESAGHKRWIDAAQIVLGMDGMDEDAVDPAPSEGGGSGTMMDAVVRIAIDHGKPISKADMRSELIQAGFPKERLGNYFYTVIARLKERQRIDVLANGDIIVGRNVVTVRDLLSEQNNAGQNP